MKKTGRKFLYLWRPPRHENRFTPEPEIVVDITTTEQLHAVSLQLLAERSPAWRRYENVSPKEREVLWSQACNALERMDGAEAYNILCKMSKNTGHEYDAMHIVEEVFIEKKTPEQDDQVVTLQFSSKTLAIIEQLKREFGITSKAEVIRKALALLEIAREAKER